MDKTSLSSLEKLLYYAPDLNWNSEWYNLISILQLLAGWLYFCSLVDCCTELNAKMMYHLVLVISTCENKIFHDKNINKWVHNTISQNCYLTARFRFCSMYNFTIATASSSICGKTGFTTCEISPIPGECSVKLNTIITFESFVSGREMLAVPYWDLSSSLLKCAVF